MPAFPSREFLAAICIALAIALVTVWQSPPQPARDHQSQPKSTASANGNAAAEPIKSEPEYHRELVILGVKPGEWLLVVVTFMLFWATRGLVKSADRTAERQLRAYLLPAERKVVDFDRVPSFHVQIENTGQTPAYNVKGWIGIHEGDFPLTQQLDWTSTETGTITNLGPRQHLNMRIEYHSVLTPEQKAALQNRSKAIYVFGEITYEDVFGRARHTRYQLMCGGPVGLLPDGRLIMCAEGNEAN